MVFTENRVIWKQGDIDAISYDRLFDFLNTGLSDMLANERARNDMNRVIEFFGILDNDSSYDRWMEMFRELCQMYPFPVPSA